jgi:hypothetical protein
MHYIYKAMIAAAAMPTAARKDPFMTEAELVETGRAVPDDEVPEPVPEPEPEPEPLVLDGPLAGTV